MMRGMAGLGRIVVTSLTFGFHFQSRAHASSADRVIDLTDSQPLNEEIQATEITMNVIDFYQIFDAISKSAEIQKNCCKNRTSSVRN